jgi:magnesium transporter
MNAPISLDELREKIAAGDSASLSSFCKAGHPAAIAEQLCSLSSLEAWQVLHHASQPLQAEIFSHLQPEIQTEIIDLLQRDQVGRLVSHMPPDDRADLFKRLPEDRQEAILPALAQAKREDIRRLAAYQEGTAGAVMTSDYATLAPDLTVAEAIEQLRRVAPDRETIYYSYVVDSRRHLLGFISLKDLILARRDARIDSLMHREVIQAHVDDDQEDAARKIQKFDLIALPVTDSEDALVGIITHDDAIDIITQEHTEDMEKFMAIAGSHEASMYLKTSTWRHFKNRAVWVVALAVLGLVSGFIVQSFEGLLLQFAILAAFMPMLADTGGNTGSQSATLVVRALALREITPRDLLRILGKEFRIALMLGILLSGVAYGRVMLLGGGSTIPEGYALHAIGLAIALALGLQVVTATLIGAMLPLAAARFKLDPAVVASPALTTIVDITGLLIYFSTVKLLLGL